MCDAASEKSELLECLRLTAFGFVTLPFGNVTENKNDARDLLFLGMLRDLKGVDVFLEAIARLDATHGHKLTAHVVGQSEEPGRYEFVLAAF